MAIYEPITQKVLSSNSANVRPSAFVAITVAVEAAGKSWYAGHSQIFLSFLNEHDFFSSSSSDSLGKWGKGQSQRKERTPLKNPDQNSLRTWGKCIFNLQTINLEQEIFAQIKASQADRCHFNIPGHAVAAYRPYEMSSGFGSLCIKESLGIPKFVHNGI